MARTRRSGSAEVAGKHDHDPAVQRVSNENADASLEERYEYPSGVGSVAERGADEADSLEQVGADLQGCMRCKLCMGRKTVVVGEGHPHADLMFIGEGPGEQEDIQGRPFVGAAGQLLDRMIEAMGIRREQVYIANVVKCRPPGNRNPEPDEIEACSPFLQRQIRLIQPKIIVALGKFAAQTLLQTDRGILSIRGKFQEFKLGEGRVKLMPTLHPAYLLRNPDAKRDAWADLQLVARELGIEIPKRKGGST